MRVLHIVPQLFDAHEGVIGGAERYAWELARSMSAFVSTTLLSFGPHARHFREGTLEVQVLGNPWLVAGQASNPWSLQMLPLLLRADIIHCHQRHVLMSSTAAVVARAVGKKVFVTDLGGGGRDISNFIDTTRWFHGHLHISEYSRRISGQTNDPRAHVILGGVDTQRFSPDSMVEKSLGILFVGRLLPHKGIDRVIEALPANVPLDIVGHAYHVQYLERLRQLSTGKQVTFHLAHPDSDLINMYRKARCVILPSVYRDCYGQTTQVPELLGQTLLEGMACGLPAICTDVASMPEVVVPDVTGAIVPSENSAAMHAALLTIWENPTQAQALGSAARQRVLERFTWDAVVKRCLNHYRGSTN